MVITNVNQVVYRGDGVTTAFPFTFRIIDATDIKLLLIDADGTETDIQSDYFVDTVNNTVHYPGYAPGAEPPEADQPAPVQTGQNLVIYRELPITQEKDLGDKWPFFVIELALDKLTLILQQIYGWWGRTLKFGVGWQIDHPDFDTTIPVEAGKTWRVNDEGTGFVATGDPDEAVVVANNAKDVAAGAKATAEGIAATAQEAKDIAQDAKTVADDAKYVAARAKATAEGIAAAAQADWNVTDTTSKAFIKNKPDVLLKSGGTLTGVVNGVTPPNGDNSKKLATTEFVNAKAGLPVGFEAFTTNPNLQAGWLPLLGGEYSRETYADLWAWVQTQNGYLLEESAWQAKAAANGGNVPYYSSGDGSTTFRVPALKCWVKGTDGSAQLVGSYLEAGLPNIVAGKITTQDWGGIETQLTGAWVETDHKTKVANTNVGTSADEFMFTFDASHSNSIYGKSSTVQPESIVGMWVVKAYGTVTNVGSTDVSAIAQGLTEAETRISTAALTGVVQAFAGRTMPQGWLLCDGSAVSRTDYAALFAVIGTTYGTGNGSTTFNLPNLVDKFIEGSATSGTEKSAGLPNITGFFQTRYPWNNAVSYGAFKNQPMSEPTLTQSSAEPKVNHNGYLFDASESNSIYGNSTTVQPPALTMRYIIKY